MLARRLTSVKLSCPVCEFMNGMSTFLSASLCAPSICRLSACTCTIGSTVCGCCASCEASRNGSQPLIGPLLNTMGTHASPHSCAREPIAQTLPQAFVD